MALNPKQGLSKLLNLQIGWYIILIEAFMLISIKLFFPQDTDKWQTIIMIYLILNVLFFALPDLKSSMFGTPLRKALPKFLLFFFGTLIILLPLSGLLLNANYLKLNLGNLPIGLIFLQVFVVAFSEESIFRDVLGNRIGQIFSSILFALFHYVVYMGNIISMFIAFGAGMLFFFIKNKFGHGIDSTPNIAVHAAINLHLLGITRTILGGG